jgi:transketolase
MSSIAISDPDPRAIATIRTLCIDAVGWERYVGANGAVVGMDTFGASAPLKELQGKFGFIREGVVGIAKARLAASAAG